MGYDFSSLSAYEFEAIVADLLSARDKARYEVFAPGPDGGIDLRFIARAQGKGRRRRPTRASIVQCKHFVRSGFSKLSTAVAKERDKALALGATRYSLATSVPLTPANKRRLVERLAPVAVDLSDVLGQDDLNALLRDHPEVEKAHFKLWLTSTAVLEAILHRDIAGRSESVLADIERKATLYVESDAFPGAGKLLEEHGICVISGQPGIGKTTLAEMLLLELRSRGFEVVVVSEDISEAERLYAHERPQVFYYDDFLGQASTAEKLGKNEDGRLAQFMLRIGRAHTNKRLLLTTREYILQDARLRYEKLFHSDLELHKYVLDLERYTRHQKAEILYNHLYFSDLSPEALNSLLADRHYLQLVDHPNYSPRLIEYIARLGVDVPPAEFGEFAFGTLERPERLWQHAFDFQLKEEEQNLLLVLCSMPGEVLAEDLRTALFDYTQRRLTNGEWTSTLKVLEGTFTETTMRSDGMRITFSNPSVRDFLMLRLSTSEVELLALLANAAYFEQVEYLLRRALPYDDQDVVGKSLEAMLAKSRPKVMSALERSVDLESAQFEQVRLFGGRVITERRSPEHVESRALFVLEYMGTDLSDEWLHELMATLSGRWKARTGSKRAIARLAEWLVTNGYSTTAEVRQALETARDWLFGERSDIEDFAAARDFAAAAPTELIPADLSEDHLQEFETHMEELIDVMDDLDDEDFLSTWNEWHEAYIEYLDAPQWADRVESASERADHVENRGSDPDDEWDYEPRDDRHSTVETVELEIDRMFQSLNS